MGWNLGKQATQVMGFGEEEGLLRLHWYFMLGASKLKGAPYTLGTTI